MRVRKLLVMIVVLSLVFGTAAFAETISQSIKVEMNKKDIADGGLLVDNKAYVGVGALAKAMQAMVSWDNDAKKATIYKPNVHMITMKDNLIFGSVNSGRTKFQVLAQIDSLETDISAFKVTISNIYGDETLIDGRDSSDKDFPNKKDFWFKSKEFSYDFDIIGPYTIKFWMKKSGDSSSYQIVSEKVISSVSGK